MKLYHCPQTRSFRPLWLLEEIQIDYEIELVDIFHGAGKDSAYLGVNPYGKVPTLDDNGLIIYEAGAICMYLTDRYGEQFAPSVDSPARGMYYQWMFFVPATLEPPLMNIFLHSKFLPEDQRLAVLVEQGKKQFHLLANNINRVLQDRLYLLGEQFSTADIMLASTLQWFPDLLDGHPDLQSYADRLTHKPAYQRAITKL